MELEASTYNRSNALQTSDALEMIDKIVKDFPQGDLDIIVDIGCGTGNVTHLLGKSIPHKRILAFDIDPKMIEFATNNYTEEDIEFLEQDIAQPWHLLNPKIKALEGTVNLIFTNYVLHWIKDKTLTFQNMYRLLKPGGFIYFTVALLKSLCDFIPLEEKNAVEKFLNYDSPGIQVSKNTFHFRETGFQDLQTELIDQEWNLGTPQCAQDFLKLVRNCYLKKASISAAIEAANLEMILKIEQLIFKAFSVKNGQLPPEQFCKNQSTVFNYSWVGRAQKPENA